MRGYVYILSNRAMPGLVKIGFTTRTLHERIGELSSTGVPARFELEFYCEVDQAAYFERETHRKLRHYRFEKEFFKCTIANAVEAVKHVASNGRHIIYDSGGPSAQAYLTEHEKYEIARIAEYNRRQAELLEQQRRQMAEQRRIAAESLAAQIQSLGVRFNQIAPKAEEAIRRHCSLGKNEGIKTIALFALALTGVGVLLFDKVSPPCYIDGENVARKMSPEEKQHMIDLHVIVQELVKLNKFNDIASGFYNRKRTIDENYLITREGEGHKYYLSDLSVGVLSGLGQTAHSPNTLNGGRDDLA